MTYCMMTTFESIMLDLVLRIKVERFVEDCDQNTTEHLFLYGADKDIIFAILWNTNS